MENESVRPGINDPFLNNLKPEEYSVKFESEGRSIYDFRKEIAEQVSAYITPGMTVVDAGVGTGLFMRPFAALVGSQGHLYCLDIGERFIPYLEAKMAAWREEGTCCDMMHLRLVGHTDFGGLADVDVIFTSDTYHHIEFPSAWLAAAHQALKPNGVLIVIDFEKIEGVSTEWVIGHVRAPKEIVVSEIANASFVLEKEIPLLPDNYFHIWRKK